MREKDAKVCFYRPIWYGPCTEYFIHILSFNSNNPIKYVLLSHCTDKESSERLSDWSHVTEHNQLLAQTSQTQKPSVLSTFVCFLGTCQIPKCKSPL